MKIIRSLDFNVSHDKKIHQFWLIFVNLTDSHAESALKVGNSETGDHINSTEADELGTDLASSVSVSYDLDG